MLGERGNDQGTDLVHVHAGGDGFEALVIPVDPPALVVAEDVDRLRVDVAAVSRDALMHRGAPLTFHVIRDGHVIRVECSPDELAAAVDDFVLGPLLDVEPWTPR